MLSKNLSIILLRYNTIYYYLDAILNCDSMSKYVLLVGLEGFPVVTPVPW